MKAKMTLIALLSLLLLALLAAPYLWEQPLFPAQLVTALQQPPGCPDTYEPNDSIDNAWPLEPGIIDSYICCMDQNVDYDWFSFEADAGDTIILKLYDLPANYDICLLDPKENVMECSQNHGNTDEHIEKTAYSTGEHYAMIYGVQGACDSGQSYTFILDIVPDAPTGTPTGTLTPTPTATEITTETPTTTPTVTVTPTPTSACPDPYEPNETFPSAWPLNPGVYEAYICYAGDQDWFLIHLAPGQPLDVTLTGLPANYDLEVYDPLGVRIASSHNAGTLTDHIYVVASHTGGPWRVRVFGVAGAWDAVNPYTLKLELGPAPPAPTPTLTPTYTPVPICGPDAYEPNDSAAEAAPIPVGSAIQAYLCPSMDSDYFRITVGGVREIQARLYDLPAAYALTLYNPSGGVVARGAGSGTSPRELTYLATSGGNYVLRVGPSSPTSWDPDRPYSLLVNLAELSPMSLPAVADTYVIQELPTSTHGDERLVIVGRDEFGQEHRGLFRFDLSRVPAATITSAYLRLSLYDSASGVYDLDLRRIVAGWNEDTVNWNTLPWSVATGVSAPVGGIMGQYYEWEVTALVQSWLSGGVGNYGLELRPGAGTFSRSFRSREYASGMFAAPGLGSARTPRLIINFTEESVGPLGSISGSVFHDADGDGHYEAAETGIPGVRLELFRDRVSQGTQFTAADGSYSFSGLRAGEYEVALRESALPAEYRLLDRGTRGVSLSAGENRSGVDIGVGARPTPPPTPPPTLNLTAQGIEFIQVIQGGTLIEGKRTLARVYVGVSGATGDVPNITGRLYHGFDWINAIAPATLRPGTDPMNDPLVMSDMSRTLNFLLPDSWTSAGHHDFIAWVNYDNPGLECPGCWDAGNQYSTWARGTSPTFYRGEPLHLSIVEVTAAGTSAPSVSHADLYRWMELTFPVSHIVPYADSLSVSYTLTDTSGCDRCCGTGWSELLQDLDRTFLSPFGSAGGGDSANIHYYGIVDHTVPHCWIPTGSVNQWCCGGCGMTPGQVAAGLVNPANLAGAGVTLAHEFGHNLGRRHTCGCGEAGCENQHPGAVIGVYGVDLGNPSAPVYLDPITHFDLMSYCRPRWISDITFDVLRDIFRPTGAGAQETRDVSLAAQKEYLITSGSIVDGLVTITRPFERASLPTGTDDASGLGRYALELQNAGGTTLFTRYFDTVGDTEDPIEGSGYFRQVVPWQAGTARILIMEGQTVLQITHVSAHAPQVTLLSPNGGEVWPPYGQQTISWVGSDTDGDPLRYSLQYSSDGGDTWKPVAVNLTGESFTIDAGTLAGSGAAKMRVVASDGVHVAMDLSDGTFSVEPKPPTAIIFYPVNGHVFPPGGPVLLEGAGTDLEDGPLTEDRAFRWTSSLEGELGIGRHLYFDDLLPGWHTITLGVSDSDGYTTEESVAILIGHRLALPLLLKASG